MDVVGEDDDEMVELTVELLEVLFPVGVGPTTVAKTDEKTTVVIDLPAPRPTEVDKMVVVIVEPPDESVPLVVF